MPRPCDASERFVPTGLQLTRDQSVQRIGSVILAEGAIGRIASRFEITQQSVTDLIASLVRRGLGRDSRRDCSGLNDLKQRRLDRIVDAQASEGDAARLAIIELSAMTGVAGNVVAHASVANRQLSAAAPAADKAGQ